MKFSLLLFVIGVCFAKETLLGLSGQALVPNAKRFKNREALAKSSFWRDMVKRVNPVTALATSIYIEKDKAVYVFSNTVPTKTWWGGSSDPDIVLTQLLLGDEINDIEVDHFPLITISAEYSSNQVTVEREVASGYGIVLSSSLRVTNTLVQTGITTGLDSAYSFSLSVSESMVCRAPPGGRAQMQVSINIKQFPAAKTRQVTFKQKTGAFENGKWDKVTSEIHGDSYEGAMFYETGHQFSQRCVTDPNYFQDPHDARWINV